MEQPIYSVDDIRNMGDKEEKIKCLMCRCYDIVAVKILGLCGNNYSWATILFSCSNTYRGTGKQNGRKKKKRGGDDEDDRALVTMFYFFPEEFQVFIRHPDTVSKFQSWYVILC